MKLLVTLVFSFGKSEVGPETTWFVDEVRVRRGKSVVEILQEHIRDRRDKFIDTTRMKPSLLSVCHTILPTKTNKKKK